MTVPCDLLITGSGNFAERILLDLALMAEKPLRILMAGRPVELPRMEWLRQAANARAGLAGRPVFVETGTIDWTSPETIAPFLERAAPRLIVHAASVQPPSVVFERNNAWGLLVKACTITVTVPIQALLGARLARAMALAGCDAVFLNSCYPDGTNAVLAGLGFPVLCGAGNIGILASAFAGELGWREEGRVRVLAHHQNIMPWRGPVPKPTIVPPPRVWLDGVEIDDVYARFTRVRLTEAPAIPISGFCGVPVILSLLRQRDHVGHVPGPWGLPGGYPIKITGGELSLELPPGLTRAEAVAWQTRYELANGLTVAAGRLTFHGPCHTELARHSPSLAAGFALADLEEAASEILALRERLEATPAKLG
ncbi:MAG: hypothetical protein FJX57_21055 [Alphaproteobacteria bacterium]|nr:hypothetical protein [Alphaproteobacteria bacterium]